MDNRRLRGLLALEHCPSCWEVDRRRGERPDPTAVAVSGAVAVVAVAVRRSSPRRDCCSQIEEVACIDVEEDAAVAAAAVAAGCIPTARPAAVAAGDHHRCRDSWAVAAVGDVALFLLLYLLLLYLPRLLHREMVVVVAAVDGTLVAMEIVGRLKQSWPFLFLQSFCLDKGEAWDPSAQPPLFGRLAIVRIFHDTSVAIPHRPVPSPRCSKKKTA
jgi:hypothetical protein